MKKHEDIIVMAAGVYATLFNDELASLPKEDKAALMLALDKIYIYAKQCGLGVDPTRVLMDLQNPSREEQRLAMRELYAIMLEIADSQQALTTQEKRTDEMQH